MRPGDLAPDNADLGALDGALGTVDVCDVISISSLAIQSWSDSIRTCYALTGVPLCRGGVINAFKLQERSAGVGVALSIFRQ